ncbi:MAG: hypothetical protein BGO67_04525 [Alphaproteobacteria bacterium 41-28]|nr:MAG: hypothetical protein BGO67_04525 [Alphaproteobacteria bacterium 41-28]
MNYINIVTIGLTGTLLTACMSAQEHRQDVGAGPSTFTLGMVQSSVQKGMPQDQVVAFLGSPNIVTTDEHGNESWVYDKISSEAAHSSSSGGGGLIFFGGQKSAGAYETSQKTLTVMIKFDHLKRVQSLNYHQSKF